MEHQSVKPGDRHTPDYNLGPIAKALIATGKAKILRGWLKCVRLYVLPELWITLEDYLPPMNEVKFYELDGPSCLWFLEPGYDCTQLELVPSLEAFQKLTVETEELKSRERDKKLVIRQVTG